MSIKTSIVCDGCGTGVSVCRDEKPHQVRSDLRRSGWVRALFNGVIVYEGPLDYCRKCFNEMKKKSDEGKRFYGSKG